MITKRFRIPVWHVCAQPFEQQASPGPQENFVHISTQGPVVPGGSTGHSSSDTGAHTHHRGQSRCTYMTLQLSNTGAHTHHRGQSRCSYMILQLSDTGTHTHITVANQRVHIWYPAVPHTATVNAKIACAWWQYSRKQMLMTFLDGNENGHWHEVSVSACAHITWG